MPPERSGPNSSTTAQIGSLTPDPVTVTVAGPNQGLAWVKTQAEKMKDDCPQFYVMINKTPIPIKTVDDLRNMKSGNTYRLESDLDLSGIEWRPDFYEFTVFLFGGGHTISGMNASGKFYAGLFLSLTCGAVTDLKMVNPVATATSDVSNGSAGPIFGLGTSSLLSNVSVLSPNIKGSFGGGIGGRCVKVALNNIKVAGGVVEASYAGGICGESDGSGVTHASSAATIKGNMAGGAFGIGHAAGLRSDKPTKYDVAPVSVQHFLNSGAIEGAYIGGIIGFIAEKRYEPGCQTEKWEVFNDVANYGVLSPKITGTIVVTAAGGIVGYIENSNPQHSVSIERFFFRGDLSTGPSNVIGVVSQRMYADHLTQIYPFALTCRNGSWTAGAAGSGARTWFNTSCAPNVGPISAAAAVVASSFSGFDFGTVWQIDPILGGPAPQGPFGF